jgi:hypothetical protein
MQERGRIEGLRFPSGNEKSPRHFNPRLAPLFVEIQLGILEVSRRREGNDVPFDGCDAHDTPDACCTIPFLIATFPPFFCLNSDSSLDFPGEGAYLVFSGGASARANNAGTERVTRRIARSPRLMGGSYP